MTSMTEAAIYTRPDGTPYDVHDAAIIEGVRADLLSGRKFALHAMSDRSAIGYRPPTHRDQWAHAMETLGRMAHQSDAFAQVAAAIFGRVNLYQTPGEMSAQVWEGAGRALADGFDDVIGRSGPEPGRWRDHQRDFTLHERVHLYYWMIEATAPCSSGVPCVGWCVDAIARAESVYNLPRPVRRCAGDGAL